MKKILVSLASLVLISSSVASSTAWTQNQHKPTVSSAVGIHSETAQEIANKLINKTVRLNLDEWKGKKIMDNIPQFRNDLVNQGLLTKDEAQYVYNGNVKWAVSKVQTAPGCVFLVKKDGQTASAYNISLAIFQDTATSIASKLNGKTIKLYPYYWMGRSLHSAQAKFRNVLVQEHILTKNEAQYVLLPSFFFNTRQEFYSNVTFYVIKGSQTVVIHNVKFDLRRIDSGIISSKLRNKSIKLDPKFWVGKNLRDYKEQLDDAIVKSGILNFAESRYVASKGFVIQKAIVYRNQKVYVREDFGGWNVDVNFDVATLSQKIADKLNNKTVNLNPNFWLGKDIKTNRSTLVDRLVNQNIITYEEAQYVSWGNLNISKAQKYVNVPLTVQKNGITVNAHLNLDANYEATKIANKLTNKTIRLNPKFWVGKNIKNYKEQLDDAIVSQGILTKEEVQYVSWGDLTLNQARSYPKCAFTVSKDGHNAIAKNITLDTEYEANKIANKLSNKTIRLTTYWLGDHLGDPKVRKNFEDELIYQRLATREELQYVTWPDVHINRKGNYTNLDFIVSKDGHEAIAKNITIRVD